MSKECVRRIDKNNIKSIKQVLSKRLNLVVKYGSIFMHLTQNVKVTEL